MPAAPEIGPVTHRASLADPFLNDLITNPGKPWSIKALRLFYCYYQQPII